MPPAGVDCFRRRLLGSILLGMGAEQGLRVRFGALLFILRSYAAPTRRQYPATDISHLRRFLTAGYVAQKNSLLKKSPDTWFEA